MVLPNGDVAMSMAHIRLQYVCAKIAQKLFADLGIDRSVEAFCSTLIRAYAAGWVPVK